MIPIKTSMKKHILLLAALANVSVPNLPAQAYFVAQDADDYYEWFQQHSNASALFSDQTTLYTFARQTPLREEPCEESQLILTLTAGETVRNQAYGVEDFVPTAEIRGYLDQWFQVVVDRPDGTTVPGYIWGGHLAKAWHAIDLSQDGGNELVLLGLTEQQRAHPRDIRAELKVIRSGQIISTTELPGMCVFGECDSDALLRTFSANDQEGMTMLEASTMMIGCTAGIERAFFIWKGNSFECVFYGEMTTQRTYKASPFAVRLTQKAGSAQICRFQGIGEDFNPVWQCADRKITASTSAIP